MHTKQIFIEQLQGKASFPHRKGTLSGGPFILPNNTFFNNYQQSLVKYSVGTLIADIQNPESSENRMLGLSVSSSIV